MVRLKHRRSQITHIFLDLSREEKKFIEDQWKEVSDFVEDREMETVEYFQHVTSKGDKDTIVREGKLRAYSDRSKGSPLSKNKDVKGVFFCTTLYKGDLPDQSPYGEYRVAVPIQHIVRNVKDWALFFERAHHYGKVQYVRMVLVKKSKSKYDWCKHNLQPVDIGGNGVLEWDGDVECVKASKKSDDKYRYTNIYTEVFVVGDVLNLEKCKWGEVYNTGTSRTSPTPGVLKAKYKL